tara:strand:- start:256 stop:492 length:237 start_codon:yes stop_codon:yes gene_type:complete
MVTANTKTYILPPLPQRQAPTVIEVSPQPQDMKNFSKFIPKGVKDSLKKIRRLRPHYSIKGLKIAYSGGTITPFLGKK